MYRQSRERCFQTQRKESSVVARGTFTIDAEAEAEAGKCGLKTVQGNSLTEGQSDGFPQAS